ncbi:hypothetical protein FRC09_014570 [Ceratobasidium sp. 395]|nr:hypothetical protein FRC09_014570 [Ceratobasidium sp. 395]
MSSGTANAAAACNMAARQTLPLPRVLATAPKTAGTGTTKTDAAFLATHLHLSQHAGMATAGPKDLRAVRRTPQPQRTALLPILPKHHLAKVAMVEEDTAEETRVAMAVGAKEAMAEAARAVTVEVVMVATSTSVATPNATTPCAHQVSLLAPSMPPNLSAARLIMIALTPERT